MRTRISICGSQKRSRRRTAQIVQVDNGQPIKPGSDTMMIPRKIKPHRLKKNVHRPKIKSPVLDNSIRPAKIEAAKIEAAKIEAAKKLANFTNYKKSDICVLLGSGPSICDISEKEWEIISQWDSCAMNNWVYHPTFVPNFYFIEVKWYNYDLIQRRLAEKFEEYKDVVFLFPKGKGIRNPHTNMTVPLKDVAKGFSTRIEYNLVSRDRKRTHKTYTADYKMHVSKFTKSYDMSITCVFEFLFRMGYKKVILYGIDLSSSLYFWTGGDSKYGEVHHQWNKQHEDRDHRLPHTTYKIKDFIIDFNERWMKPAEKEIMIGHKTTVLYPYLKYVNVEEL